jgi:predicted CXXCH cytochrome family protein
MIKFTIKSSIFLMLFSLVFLNTLFALEVTDDMNKHAPFESKDCGACHTDDNGKSGKLKIEGDKLCFTCHPDFEKKVTESKIKHGAMDMGGCLGCHDPHATEGSKLLKAETPKDLCLTCHSAPLPKDEDGTMLSNIGEHLANNPDAHGPVMWGDCAACHDPHGSDYNSILKYPFPKKSTIKFTADGYLCFKCHEPKKISDKRTKEFTNFRNGDKNIHFLHVKTKTISCKACHDYHASSGLPHHLMEEGNFGNSKFPLRFVDTPTGGSCNPICHTRRHYDRVNPVNVRTNKKLK